MIVSLLLTFELTRAYAGSRACGGCHPAQYARQSKSRHAEALHRGSDSAAFDFLQSGTVTETPDPSSASFEFQKTGQSFSVAVTRGKDRLQLPIDWIFGAGAQGLTFFSRLRDGEYLEHRFSYYTKAGGYDITTGQSGGAAGSLQRASGLPLTSGIAFQCLNCHTTQVSQTSAGPDFNSVVPGITCERCHGPGAAHIQAVQGHAADLHIRDLRKLSGEDIVSFCGECHRTEPPPGVNFDDPIATRFQPVGLQMSACFQKSDGAIHCVTCHNPHEDAHHDDPAFYDGKCLACHSGGTTAGCKMNSSSGCIKCHMPRVNPVPHLSFTDHWIRKQ